MAAGASTEGFGSRELWMGAGRGLKFWSFRDFPVGSVVEVIAVIRECNRGESEVEVSSEPVRGSRDSGEDFIIVGGGKGEVSFDMMSAVGSDDHTATFSCLDRVIIIAEGKVVHIVQSLLPVTDQAADVTL